jgi:mono/diheme cytochrome c family protein
MFMRMITLPKALLIVALLSAGTAGAENPLEPFMDYNGDQLFQRFCASCHGSKGYGDGPVAASFKAMIPDLTRLSKRAGGSFPAKRVLEIIDGRAVLPEHGSRAMPVWGYEFEAQVPPDQPGRATAQTLIYRLVEHLRSMQQ